MNDSTERCVQPDRLFYGPNGHAASYPSATVPTTEYIRADLLKAELALAKELLDRWNNQTDIPDPDCTCHKRPPCRDCIEWGALRETAAVTKRLLERK